MDAFTRHGVPHARAIADTPGAGSAGGIGFAALLLGARRSPARNTSSTCSTSTTTSPAPNRRSPGREASTTRPGHGKLPHRLARRAHLTPAVAVAGRNTLPAAHWPSAGFERVYSLGDYTHRDTATDPDLTGRLLTRIGHHIATRATISGAVTAS